MLQLPRVSFSLHIEFVCFNYYCLAHGRNELGFFFNGKVFHFSLFSHGFVNMISLMNFRSQEGRREKQQLHRKKLGLHYPISRRGGQHH